MFDSCDSHFLTSVRERDGLGFVSRCLTLLGRLWLQVTLHKQDGSSWKGDILASVRSGYIYTVSGYK